MTEDPIPLQRSLLMISRLSLWLSAAALLVAFGTLVAVLDNGKSEASPAAVRGPFGSGNPVVLAFGGDVHFEGVLESKLSADASSLLAPIAPVLGEADIAVANLETAVTNGGAATAKTFVFRTPPSAFEALRGGSIDVVSMANNHGMDFGEAGLRDSLAAAKRYRFPVIGIGLDGRRAYAPYRATVRGQRIAVLAATQVLDDHLIESWTAGPRKPGIASAKAVPRLLQEVRRARRTSDTVVVFLHWGVELEGCPTTDQRTLARELVGAGADIVVGGHAHRLLGAGRMGKALVSYGLGNFVWYGTSELSTQTGVLEVTATGRRIDRYRWVPARITEGVPRPLSGAARRQELVSWRSLRGCTGLKP
ncbi:MAG: CapA family protein [Actinomycetota bacterium]|nr:CapA family protein [Actinomycetota bacterium]